MMRHSAIERGGGMGHPTKKVNSTIIKRTLDTLGLSVNEFALETGQSPSAVHGWIRDGKAPAWVIPACEGLLAKSGKKPAPTEEVVLLVKAPAGERETLTKLLNAVGTTFSAV